MKLLLINPNTTASMTQKVEQAAIAVAQSTTSIVAVNPDQGPSSIQGYYDVAQCVPHLLSKAKEYSDYDAIVISCFDDTGLDALRCAFSVPVIGIGEAAFHMASILACKFSVITTLRRSVPGIEANLDRYGLAKRCIAVRASEIPVLELESENEEILERLGEEIQASLHEDKSEAIVLGCAGMTNLMEKLSDKFNVPIIDGVSCAITLAEALVATGLKTSKIGGYAFPATY